VGLLYSSSFRLLAEDPARTDEPSAASPSSPSSPKLARSNSKTKPEVEDTTVLPCVANGVEQPWQPDARLVGKIVAVQAFVGTSPVGAPSVTYLRPEIRPELSEVLDCPAVATVGETVRLHVVLRDEHKMAHHSLHDSFAVTLVVGGTSTAVPSQLIERKTYKVPIIISIIDIYIYIFVEGPARERRVV